MNKPSCPNELDWLAFCYAAGELDSADAEAFESRLAEEQSAREALVRAVELTQTVAAAEAQCGDLVVPAARTKADWNSRLAWMAIGGLASVLLALLWSGVVGPTWRTTQHQLLAQSQQRLASAWSQTRLEIREAGLWTAPGGSDDDEPAMLASDEMEDDAPSWMTAAVFNMPKAAAGQTSTDQPTGHRLEN
jgi:hypothetical protein